MAVALVGATLVPALAVMRDAMQMADTVDQQQMLLNYGVSMMEWHQATTAANWSTAASSGSMTGDGLPLLRYTATRSDAPANGGLTNRLMHITVTTYWDSDGDGALDANEKRCVLRTKLGKFATYEAAAGA